MKQSLKRNDARALNLYDDKAEELAIAFCFTKPEFAEICVERLQTRAFSELDRVLIFDAIRRLVVRGYPITTDAVLSEGRVVAGERGIADLSILNKETIDKYTSIDISGASLNAVMDRLSRLSVGQRVTPVIEQLIDLLGKSPDEETLYRQIGAIIVHTLDDVRSPSILYGHESVGYLNSIIAEEIASRANNTRRKPPTWPWKALVNVSPIPAGLVGYIGGPDGSGKSTIAEMCGEHFAFKDNLNVGYFHTEYPSAFMMKRRLARWSGIQLNRLIWGDSDSRYLSDEEMAIVEERQAMLDERLYKMHYVFAGGMTMSEVIGQMHIMRQAGMLDVVILDYFHDLDFPVRSGSSDWSAQGQAMKDFHHTLGRLEVSGLVVVRGKKEMLNAIDLDRSMIEGSSAAVYKSQMTWLIVRDEIKSNYGDLGVVYKNGIYQIVPTGEKGKLSKRIRCRIDKQTIGEPHNFDLWFGGPNVIQDLPGVIVDEMKASGLTYEGLRDLKCGKELN